jgi:hypothetical protein
VNNSEYSRDGDCAYNSDPFAAILRELPEARGRTSHRLVISVVEVVEGDARTPVQTPGNTRAYRAWNRYLGYPRIRPPSLSLSLSLSRPWFSSRAAPPHTFPILMHPRRIHIPHSCCLVPGKYFLARAYNLRVYPRGSEFSRMHKRYSFACPHRSFTVSRDITASPFIRDGTNPRSCLFITRVRVHADS